MTTLTFTATTTLTPQQYIDGLTDFGPNRSDVFPNSANDYLVVHDRGTDWADVTEGSKGTWERLHYDWSDPDRVVLTTTDSNAWGGASGHTYTFTSNTDGTTNIQLVSVRDGKNFKGRFFAIVFAMVGKKVLGGAFENSVRAIEARNQRNQSNNSGSDSSKKPTIAA
jgi:hypothetical protein